MYFPNSAEKFRRLLESVRGLNVAVFGHVRPDGDCVSSMFATADTLREAGAKKVVCVDAHPLPRLYKNFAFGEEIVPAKNFDGKNFHTVCVDCSSFSRTGAENFSNLPFLATIDHHVSSGPSGALIDILEPDAAAAAELIAGMHLDSGISISQKNAERLFMGIMMDTRQLTTPSAKYRTWEIASELVKLGADPAKVARELYQRESFAKIKLLASYLKTLTMHFDNRVCIGLLESGVYERTGAEKADSDGLVDYARSIDGVEVAALLEHIPDGVKGSLRAKDPKFRVDEIAAKFGGGGHMAAAGFTAKGMDINTFYPQLLSAIEEHLREIDSAKKK